MFGKVAPVVPAGVDVEFVRDVPCCECPMQRFGTRVKTIVILRTTIEVNRDVSKVRCARERQRIHAVPEIAIWGRAKKIAEDAESSAFC